MRPGKKQKYKGQDEPTRRAAEPRGQRPASPGEPTAQVCDTGARSASYPTARASGTETRSPHTCTASHPHLTFCTSGDDATTWDGRQSCGPGIWTTHQPWEQLTMQHGEARIKRWEDGGDAGNHQAWLRGSQENRHAEVRGRGCRCSHIEGGAVEGPKPRRLHRSACAPPTPVTVRKWQLC